MNILFIQCDQLAASFLPCYGNKIAYTPNLDKLADKSAVFDSAYSNFPLCAPSRFSMMSGQLASNIAVYDNGAEFISSIPTFAHYLRALNYQTCLVGKMHFVGADQLHGFEQRLTTDIYPSDFNWTGDWTETSLPHSNNDSTFTNAGVCLRNVQMEYDEEVCHRTCRKIFDLARGDDDRPFFLTVSMTHPHDPYQCSQQHWDRFDHNKIDMPTVERIKPDQSDPYSKRLLTQYGLETFSPSEEQIRTARHAYYGSINYLDDQVGKIFETLEQTGLSENTAIIFTSDHGDMLGERGLWYKKIHFENSVRVPLMMYVPGIKSKAIKENVSLVDLLPTMVEIGSEGNATDLIVDLLDGNSLLPLASGTTDNWSDTVYSENLAEGAETPVLMVKQGSLKYIVSGKDPDQLFDLEKDKDELINEADNPSYADAKSGLLSLVNSNWDLKELGALVEQSQKRRLFLMQILTKGKKTSWDFIAEDQAAEQCLRSGTRYNDWAYSSTIGLNNKHS